LYILNILFFSFYLFSVFKPVQIKNFKVNQIKFRLSLEIRKIKICRFNFFLIYTQKLIVIDFLAGWNIPKQFTKLTCDFYAFMSVDGTLNGTNENCVILKGILK